MFEETADTVISVIDASADFPDPPLDIPIVDNKIVKKDSPCNLVDLMSNEKRGSSVLQGIKKLGRTYGLSVSSDVPSVQRLIKKTLAVFVFAGGNETLLVDLK